MEIIKANRGQGKTTELIKTSSTTKQPILCMNEMSCRAIKEKAFDMELDIPDPISIHDIGTTGRGRKDLDNGILIDEIDFVLEGLLGLKVGHVTTSSQITVLKENNKNTITQEELIKKLNIQLSNLDASMSKSLEDGDFDLYDGLLFSIDRLVTLISRLNGGYLNGN